MNNLLTIYFTGEPKLLLNNVEIMDQFSHKSLAMIFYIHANNNKISREQVSNLLWENSDEKAARYNLRYNIWTINKLYSDLASGHKLIISNKNCISLNPKLIIETDIEILKEFDLKNDTIINDEKLMLIKNKCKGNFMESFYLRNCNAFNDWMFYERENFQKKYNYILNSLKDSYIRKKQYTLAAEILDEMIKLNPYDEKLFSDLIKVHVWKGNRIQALKEYNRCTNVLREELNIAPLESTKKLIDMIKSTDIQRNMDADHLEQVIEFKFKCSKIYKIQYGFISELIQKLMSDAQLFSYIQPHIDKFGGLHYLQPMIFKNNISEREWMSIEIYDNYIFQLINALIMKMSECKNIHLVIDNSIDMDDKSQQFIVLLLNNMDSNHGNISITFYNRYFALINDIESDNLIIK